MICPILSYPSAKDPHFETLINCKLEGCAWYDEKAKQCVILTIAGNLGKISKNIPDVRKY